MKEEGENEEEEYRLDKYNGTGLMESGNVIHI